MPDQIILLSFRGLTIMRYYDRKINYYETDQMGIVHHSNYIRFFEEARCSFMEQAGYPYARLESEEIVSPTLAVSCKYIHPVRYGDEITIAVRMVRLTRLKCSFTYEITDASTGEIRARGTSEHGFITREGRPVVLPKERPEFFEMCLAEYEPEDK